MILDLGGSMEIRGARRRSMQIKESPYYYDFKNRNHFFVPCKFLSFTKKKVQTPKQICGTLHHPIGFRSDVHNQLILDLIFASNWF